jgi:excisionase family DNA binding protein
VGDLEEEFKTYTLQELAPVLGVGIETVRRYVRSGNLHAVKRGRSYYVDADELRRFMREGTTRPTTNGRARKD